LAFYALDSLTASESEVGGNSFSAFFPVQNDLVASKIVVTKGF
jgi:hypothetical protein